MQEQSEDNVTHIDPVADGSTTALRTDYLLIMWERQSSHVFKSSHESWWGILWLQIGSFHLLLEFVAASAISCICDGALQQPLNIIFSGIVNSGVSIPSLNHTCSPTLLGGFSFLLLHVHGFSGGKYVYNFSSSASSVYSTCVIWGAFDTMRHDFFVAIYIVVFSAVVRV